MASSKSTQPDCPPESWQLSGPALGYLVVLAPNDLLKPRARIAIHSESIAIGSSQALADIQFKHPHFDPVHLKLSLASDHIASIQVFGSTGVRFHDGRHLYPPIDGQQPPWITLRDRELFYISQFPFVWEQRWDPQQIDWSRFKHDPNIPSSELFAPNQAPSGPQSPARSRSPISSPYKSNASPLPSPVGSPLRNSPGKPSSSNNRPSQVNMSPIQRCFSPQPDDNVLRLDLTSTENPPSLVPNLDPELQADASQAAAQIIQDTPQDYHPTDDRPDAFRTPRANRHHAKGKGAVNGTREPSSKIVITPVKADADVAFHWEQPGSDMSRFEASSDPVASSDHDTTESFDAWKPNVSFRRRSYRRSVELVSQKRVRINGPADDSSSGDDDDGDEVTDFQDDQQEDSVPTLPSGRTTLPGSLPGSPPRATSPSASADFTSSPHPTSPSATPDISPPSSAEDTAAHRPRRKSLLQKILIKQAVEVHLAQQNEQNEPVAASGFSSSEEEDEDQANLDEVDSTDEEILPDPEPTDDSSDDEQALTQSDRMPEQKVCSSPMIVDGQPSSQLADGSPPRRVSPSAIFSTRNGSSVNPMLHLAPPAPLSAPSTSPRSLHDRRSISPNAKLLATFAMQQSAPGPSSPPASMVEFPLKSSFRRQSYTPEELSNFSKSIAFQRNTVTPSRPATLAAVKHNTHLNSRSPSFPLKDEERLRADRRTSLRGSTPAPYSNQLTPSPAKKTAVVASPLGHPTSTSSPSPHRLIRTPRSFLIKRGGSLTPLSASVCGPDPNIPVANIDEEEEDEETDEGGKRKVRFDRDVFCLEFDQLPEELPTSRQPKKPKLDPGPAPEPESDAGSTSGSSNRRASTGSSTSNRNARRRPTGSLSNTSNRPRRHSPRLPASSPAQLMSVSESDDRCSDANCAHATAAPSASVCPTVDISGLSLNPDSIDRQRASSEGPPDCGAAREVSRASLERPSSFGAARGVLLRQFGGCPELSVADNQLTRARAFGAPKGTEDSIFHNLTSRLFNFSTTGNARKRCTSLPPDLSKLTYVANPNVRKLEEKMHGLSLVTVPSEGADLLERCYSAPSSSLAASGRSRFPIVSHFSPQLVGVKQMFMEQFGMARLGGLRTMLGAFRTEQESASSSDSSDSVDDVGAAAEEKDEGKVGLGPGQATEACKEDVGLPASLVPLSTAQPRPRRKAAARVQPQPEEPTRMLRPRAPASQTEQAPGRRTRVKEVGQPRARPLAKKASQADLSTEQNSAPSSGSKPGSTVGGTCTRSTRSRARTGSSSVADQQGVTSNHHHHLANGGHLIGQSEVNNGPIKKGRSKGLKS